MSGLDFIAVEKGVGVGLLIALGLYAWARGGRTEKVGAGVIILAWVLSGLVSDSNPDTAWLQPQYGVFMVDLAALAAFLVLALRSDRFWPMTLAGGQLLAVAVHIGYIIDPRKILPAYVVLTSTIGYLLLAQAFFGIWYEVHRWRGSADDPVRRRLG